MPVPLSNLAAYSAQIACLAIGGALAVWLLRIHSAHTRHGIYRLLLLLCLLLPAVQGRQLVIAGPERAVATATAVLEAPLDLGASVGAHRFSVLSLVAFVLAGGIAVRVLWLGIGLLRLRRLRRMGVAAEPGDAHVELAADLGIPAEIRFLDGLTQPVTFGVREPVILLPDALREHAPEIQRAVLYHELLHVRRRDWVWLLAEEAVRTVLWFHPAIWWLVSRVQLSREEVVDDLVVRATGERRTYVKALLAFSDQTPLAPAPAFARKRDLFRRLERISKETVMSTKRIVLSCALFTLIIAGGTWYVVSAFPLAEAGQVQSWTSAPGPLEQQAKPVTPENPVPRRVHSVAAEYPQSLAGSGLQATLFMRLTLDQSGRVAEARVFKTSVEKKAAAGTSVDGEVALFEAAAVRAVREWLYDPPADGPLAFGVDLRFEPDRNAVMVNPAGAPLDTPAWHQGALRAGTIMPPKKLKDVRPAYPPDAAAAGVQGIVILEVRIEGDGRVSESRVMRSIPLLDQAAIDAVKQWEFIPTLLNGVPTPVIMAITVNFTLS